jgi:lysophospholipase L1-like esterase
MALHNTRVNNESTFLGNNKPYIVDVTGDAILHGLMANLAQLMPADGRGFQPYVAMYTSPPYIGRLRYALERLKKLEREYGFDIMVVLIPFLLETAETRKAYHAVYKIVEHEVSRLDFRIVTLYALFESVGFKNLLMEEEDGIHPNALGHRLIATRLTEDLATPSFAGSARSSK